MTAPTFQGANRQPVRTGAVADPETPVWEDDPDWANPGTAIGDADREKFWGVVPMRGGGVGPLKQMKLDFIFLDTKGWDVAGVTFDYYTFDIITREEAKAPLGFGTKGSRPFVRKTGAGTSFAAVESMIVDVNGTTAMGIRFSNISAGTAVSFIIVATPVEYS